MANPIVESFATGVLAGRRIKASFDERRIQKAMQESAGILAAGVDYEPGVGVSTPGMQSTASAKSKRPSTYADYADLRFGPTVERARQMAVERGEDPEAVADSIQQNFIDSVLSGDLQSTTPDAILDRVFGGSTAQQPAAGDTLAGGDGTDTVQGGSDADTLSSSFAPSRAPRPAANPNNVAQYVVQGLQTRGLPTHIAQAFAANMYAESGFDPGINEVAPLVPGSRGGFGLYQLTGPRRVQYENYAKQRGVHPSNIDAQLDFLMWELQNTERGAAQSIMQARDAAEATKLVSDRFLRPGIPRMDARMRGLEIVSGMPMDASRLSGMDFAGGGQGAIPAPPAAPGPLRLELTEPANMVPRPLNTPEELGEEAGLVQDQTIVSANRSLGGPAINPYGAI